MKLKNKKIKSKEIKVLLDFVQVYMFCVYFKYIKMVIFLFKVVVYY